MEDGKGANKEIAALLRSVATALTLKKGGIFQIRAYGTAADGIEHSTVEARDLWQEGNLGKIPGLGEKIQQHLDEYFRTGKVAHFEALKRNIPKIVFTLVEIPGVGPKTAVALADLGVNSFEGLRQGLEDGSLVKKGFSAKVAERILKGLAEVEARDDRLLLPFAQAIADQVLAYLRQSNVVEEAKPLGSLRRKVATIGDLDFAVSSNEPQKVIDHFVKMPEAARVIDCGETKASIVLKSGVQVDLLVGNPETFGALMQHFTGSKHHNIHLRTIAEKKGYSISEYGVKRERGIKGQREKAGEVVKCGREEDLYRLLGMQTPPPEIREDQGEIEAAIEHRLPRLIEERDIKGDLHIHSNFPLEPSHGAGADPIEDIIRKAVGLGYQFVGISDHPPGFTTHDSSEIIKLIDKRTRVISLLKSKFSIHVLNGLEIDILTDGRLSVPDEALATLDYCIAGIHSSHQMGEKEMTARLIKALESKHVDIISHPTGRLINKRGSFEADWETVFKLCFKLRKVLEINASPLRLDLRDDLVRTAVEYKVKLMIGSDAHEAEGIEDMPFGVWVARRGWCTKEDIINTWEWKKLAKWFNIK